MSFLGPGVGAALTQSVTGNPREWGQGFGGYGRRFASGYGRNIISNTIFIGFAGFLLPCLLGRGHTTSISLTVSTGF